MRLPRSRGNGGRQERDQRKRDRIEQGGNQRIDRQCQRGITPVRFVGGDLPIAHRLQAAQDHGHVNQFSKAHRRGAERQRDRHFRQLSQDPLPAGSGHAFLSPSGTEAQFLCDEIDGGDKGPQRQPHACRRGDSRRAISAPDGKFRQKQTERQFAHRLDQLGHGGLCHFLIPLKIAPDRRRKTDQKDRGGDGKNTPIGILTPDQAAEHRCHRRHQSASGDPDQQKNAQCGPENASRSAAVPSCQRC